ncbi:anti-sigma factor antagonist [Paenibacillus sp. LMG 31456]|uniref:Anti-sigma factor antagonist n=1 Tax=Paenibacillus foliorum TaxID=2654974 RepID=A0A972GP85_9BACL|nr:STAS domain-containing protein [Paenibacillus foliorum]NOU93620.1 anti-sigma factor antagonist [Paenibacillus foliorum]
MNVTERTVGGVVVLDIQGRLDANTSGILEACFLKMMEQGHTRFVFGLAQLDYVSSAGLRILLVAAKKLKALKGSLALVQMTDNVKEVFDISGFSTIFTIYETEAEALGEIG